MNDTSDIKSAESHEAIEARAADFLQRRRLARWSDVDAAELEAWLDEATAHRVAYLRLEDSEALIERVVDMKPSDLDRLARERRESYRMPFLAIAASLGLIAVVGFAASRYFEPPTDRSLSTDVGGRAQINFSDGTQMALDTDTALRFRMTNEERTVWLDRGEAYFDVVHDAAHPFTVIAGNHRVTDIGTEFFVRRDANGLEVALVKGRASLSTGTTQTAMLTPGDEVTATPIAMSVNHKTAQELSDELAWRRGAIVFRQTKLADAVDEINRYSKTKLVIDDPEVARMTIGGEFRTDSLDGFLAAIRTVLKLRVERDGNAILLARASDDAGTTRAARKRASQ